MKWPREPSPGGAADGPLFRPFGAGHFFAPDPAAYAAGNSLPSLRDLGIR